MAVSLKSLELANMDDVVLCAQARVVIRSLIGMLSGPLAYVDYFSVNI